MKRQFSSMAVIALGMLLSTGLASAQQPFSNVQQQPTVSPYLNLVQRQGLGLPNYQTLVRPYVRSQEEFTRQQGQISRLQRQQTAALTAGGFQGPRGVSVQIRGTGHPTQFMDYSHYFPVRR